MQACHRINVKDASLVEAKGNVCNASYFMACPCQTQLFNIGKILNLCECFISIFFCFSLKKHILFLWIINRKHACGLISEMRKVRNLCNGSEVIFGKVVLHPTTQAHGTCTQYWFKGKTRVLCYRKTMETQSFSFSPLSLKSVQHMEWKP